MPSDTEDKNLTTDENGLEHHILHVYDSDAVNTAPKTEKELLKLYQNNTYLLYQYISHQVSYFLYGLNNEIRAMFGHLADYRTTNDCMKRELDKAYGHFRRTNLDAFKILCDEYDKTFSKIIKKQYKYDLRNAETQDYLKEFGNLYFSAKSKYLETQQQERVGSDSEVHNIVAIYHNAAKEYINLKKLYVDNKKQIRKIKFKTNVEKVLDTIILLISIFVALVGYLIKV